MKSLPELSDWRSEEHEEDEQTAARPSYVARSELNTETAGRPAYADPLMIESPLPAVRGTARSSHPIQDDDDDDDDATRSPRDSYAMLEGLESARLPRPSYVAKAERAPSRPSYVAKAERAPSRPSYVAKPEQVATAAAPSAALPAVVVDDEPLAKSSDTITNYTAQKALNNLISQESITTFAPASLGAALARSRAAQEMRRGMGSGSDSVTTYDKLPPPPSPPSPRSSRVLLTTPPQQKAQSTTVADPYARTQASPTLLDDEVQDHDDVDDGLADELEPLALDSAELEELDPLHALSYPSHDDLVSMGEGELVRTNEQPQYVEPNAPIDYNALRRYLFEEEEEEKPTQAREHVSRLVGPGDDEKPTQAREIPPTSRVALSPFEIPPPPPPSTVAPRRRSRPDGALSAEEGRTPVASLLPKLAQMQRVMEERQRLSMLPPHERFPAAQPHTPHAFLPPPPPHSHSQMQMQMQMQLHDHTHAMNGMMSPSMMPIADRAFTYGTNPSNPSHATNLSSSSSLAPESWAESPWIVPATPRPSSQIPTERTRKDSSNTSAFAFGLSWTPQLAALVIGSATLLMIGIVVVVAVFVRTATAPPPPTFSNPAPTTPMVLPPPAASSTAVPPVASTVVIAPPPVADSTPTPPAAAAPSASTSPKPAAAAAPATAPKKIAATPTAPRDISPNQPAPKKKSENKGPKSLEDILSELGEEQVKR